MFRPNIYATARRLTRPTTRAFQTHGRPTYQRFSSNKPPIWQSRTFWYVTGSVGAGSFVYYQAHLEPAPVTGRKRFINVTPEQEARFAAQAYQETLMEYRGRIVPRGSPVDDYVRRVAKRVIAATGIEGVEWEVHVVMSEERNAFVLPGGKVFVFTGILPITKTEDGLAAVLGHEIAHQYARHAAEKISQSNLLSFVYILASFFVDPSLLQLGRGMTHLLTVLPNSRACEREADYLGLLFMAQACYDPRAAVGLWQRMQMAEQGSPPQFLNTHPATGDRIEKITEWLPQAELKREASCPADMASSFFGQFRH